MHYKRVYFLIVLFVLLETSFATAVIWPSFFPRLSLLVLVFTALEGGPGAGVRAGFLLGTLMGFFNLETFGACVMLYVTTGVLCGFLKGKVFTEAFISQWVIPALAYLFILFFLAVTDCVDLESANVFFPEYLLKQTSLIATLVASPPVFLLCRKLLSKRKGAATYYFLK